MSFSDVHPRSVESAQDCAVISVRFGLGGQYTFCSRWMKFAN